MSQKLKNQKETSKTRNTKGNSTKTKKGGKEFDVEDVHDKSNAEKLAHTIRLKNMFLGLFVVSSILSVFLIFRYSDKMSDYRGKKRQFEKASKSVQSLKHDLNVMTSDRDRWTNNYYDMESKRDHWYNEYSSEHDNRVYYQNQANDNWDSFVNERNDHNRTVGKWNSHVNSHYCYTSQMCSCW